MSKLYGFSLFLLLIPILRHNYTAAMVDQYHISDENEQQSTILECTLNIVRSTVVAEPVFGIVRADVDKKLTRHIDEILIELMKSMNSTMLSFNAASFGINRSTVSHLSLILFE